MSQDNKQVVKKEKKAKTQKFKKANPLIYLLFVIVSRILMFFKTKIKYGRNDLKKRNKKEGAVVLFNHQSNHDHFICAGAAGLSRLTFVVSNYYMRKPFTHFILTLVRAIPKVQFRTDLISIRKMKRATDHRGLLTIAPAGQVTLNGDTPYVDPSIVKLLKLCKVDVYAIQIKGGYLSFPKWRKVSKSRKGRVQADIVKVISKEELATMSDQEVFDKVFESIDLSDRQFQNRINTKLKSNHMIEGLENVLYVCPKCKEKYTFASSGNEMKCSHCGNTIVMDEYARIHAKTSEDKCLDNESVWYNWQSDLIKEKYLSDDFNLVNKFKLYSNLKDEKVMDEVGEGVLTMTKNALYYDGTLLNERIHKEFNFEILTQLPFSPGHHFEVPDGDGSFQFRPIDNPCTVVEWVQTIDTISKMKRN